MLLGGCMCYDTTKEVGCMVRVKLNANHAWLVSNVFGTFSKDCAALRHGPLLQLQR
jgi:hypothetical protein